LYSRGLLALVPREGKETRDAVISGIHRIFMTCLESYVVGLKIGATPDVGIREQRQISRTNERHAKSEKSNKRPVRQTDNRARIK
jgi:hypothetical protein